MRGVLSTRDGTYVRLIEKDESIDNIEVAKRLIATLKEQNPESYKEMAKSLGEMLIPSEDEEGHEYYGWSDEK